MKEWNEHDLECGNAGLRSGGRPGSFTAAARSLALTQSGVSKLLSRLEDQPGARLLRRTTRRLAPTAEGERCLLPRFLEAHREITLELSLNDRVMDLVAEHADVTLRTGRPLDPALSARANGNA